MALTTTQPSPEAPPAAEPILVPVLEHVLRPGIVLLDLLDAPGSSAGEPRADGRALDLLGCRDGAELAARWPAIRQCLAAGGLLLEHPAGTAAAPGGLGTAGAASQRPDAAAAALPGAPDAAATPAPTTPPRDAAAVAAPPALPALPALPILPPLGALAAPAAPADVELPPDLTGGRRVRVSAVLLDRTAAAGRPEAPVALLLQEAELASALASDLRAAAQMRSLAQIAPAVAHDLRAPINAMVLNLEVLKETLAPPPGSLPGNPGYPAAAGLAHPAPPYGPHPGPAPRPGSAGRDPRERQQRYLAVLREELARLHQSLELFLAHVSPRGERRETLDWRGPAQDLAALLRPPARKQQAQIELLLPDAAVPISVQRYLLRQALLHFGLAVLEQVPRDGTLEIRLERLPARARLRIAAATAPAAAPSGAAAAAPGPAAPPPAAPPAPALALAPRFSAAGAGAREQVAHAIVAAFGGTSWPADPDGDLAFEIEFPSADSN